MIEPITPCWERTPKFSILGPAPHLSSPHELTNAVSLAKKLPFLRLNTTFNLNSQVRAFNTNYCCSSLVIVLPNSQPVKDAHWLRDVDQITDSFGNKMGNRNGLQSAAVAQSFEDNGQSITPKIVPKPKESTEN